MGRDSVHKMNTLCLLGMRVGFIERVEMRRSTSINNAIISGF